jgi:hypothetical protein
LKRLTHDLYYHKKDRFQVQQELPYDIDIEFILNLKDTTDISYFIKVAYWDLKHLTNENGFETRYEEIEYLVRCFDGKERCVLKEKYEIEKMFEERERSRKCKLPD